MRRVRVVVFSASVNPSRRSMSTKQPVTLRPAVAIRTVRPRCSLRACQGAFKTLESLRPARVVPVVQPTDQAARHLGAVDWGAAAFDLDGRGPGGQLRRKLFTVEVNVQTDPDDRAPAGSGARPGAPTDARRGAGTRSTRMPAILRPSIRTSLGHLIVASRPVQDVTTSAAATAPSAVSQAQPKAASGRTGARWWGGNSRIDIKIDALGGAVHDRPRRPRPAVCSSASTTRPSLDAEVPARAARSLVLVTRFQTAIRRPIRVSPAHARSGPDKPPRRPAVGGASIRMLFDPEAKGDQRIQVEAYVLQVRTQLDPEARNRRRPRAAGPEAAMFRLGADGGRRGHDRLRSDSRVSGFGFAHRLTRPSTVFELRFEVERQIQGRRRVGQCADADSINACLSQGPNCGQIHSAGGFELDLGCQGVAAAHGLGDEFRPEVVDQDDVGPAGESALELTRVSRPRSRPSCPRGVLARAAAMAAAIGSSSARPRGCLEPGQVIVLDQDGIVQAEAVVAAPAAPDRVLFQRTPAGRGLARVVDRGARAGDRRDEPRRQGRDPAQPLQKVERGPLHRPAANASARATRAIRLPGRRESPSASNGSQLGRELKFGDQSLDGRQAGQHAGRPRDQPRGPAGVAGNRGRRRDVPNLTQVLRKRLRDQYVNVSPLALGESIIDEPSISLSLLTTRDGRTAKRAMASQSAAWLRSLLGFLGHRSGGLAGILKLSLESVGVDR